MSFVRPLLGLLLATTALPVAAADRAPIEARVDRVEKELRAVQRKVFPGGEQAFTQPEIAAPEVQATTGLPASSPINDLTARVDALEKSVAQLTSQVEQQDHRLSLLSEQSAKDRQEFSTRLQLIEQAATPPAAAAPADAAPLEAAPAPVRTSPTRAPKPAAAPPAAAASDDEPARAPTAAASGDAAEDAYMAGYRLWTQKKYGEAQSTLAAVVRKYPKHRRASYAQNLLGRAYLDAGQPARAAEAFAANYQTNPRGERAPDSLFYLGQSLAKLNKNADACRVYDEFTAAYGSTAEAGLKTRVATARKSANCK